MEFNMVSACSNCGEIIPASFEVYKLCPVCEMRLKQLTENVKREMQVFGEMRRKVRENKE